MIEKMFVNDDLEIELTSYIDDKQNVWSRGKDVATILGYSDTDKSIRIHVSEENKISQLVWPKCSPANSAGQRNDVRGKWCMFINEAGFYELVFSSKLEFAKRFRQWVFTTVLPSIRKYGQYKLFDSAWNKMIMIGNETSLHYQIIKVIRRFYPHALLLPGLGELQDTSSKRIDAYHKGYQRGQADIVINNYYQISDAQLNMEKIYKLNGYKYLCSNDDFIIKEIHDYMTGIRLSCSHCNKKFKHLNSLHNHHKYFHKITG